MKIRLARAGFKTQQSAAQAIGISDSHLAHVLSGKDAPGPKLLRWMKLKRSYCYEYIVEGLLTKPRA